MRFKSVFMVLALALTTVLFSSCGTNNQDSNNSSSPNYLPRLGM